MVWRTAEIPAVFGGCKHECPVFELHVTKLCCCRIADQQLALKQGVMQIKSLAVTHGVSSAQPLLNDKFKLMSLRLICHELQPNESSFCLFRTCQRNTCTFTYCVVPRCRNGAVSADTVEG